MNNVNFHSRAVNTVFEHREDLIECFRRIRSSSDFDDKSIKEAGGYIRLLEDPDFNFLLKLFHHIMPHVDFLSAKLQKRNIDSVHINGCIQQDSINAMVVEHSSCSDQPRKRRALEEEDHSRIAAEAYPMLNGSKLRTELSLIYGKDEFKSCCGAVDLFQLFMDNNLSDVFSETVTLLKIIITTPLSTAEAEMCFSTLKRVKIFLRNTMTQDRLNALAILTMEKKLVTEMADFNQRVIDKFASLKDRRATFLYKGLVYKLSAPPKIKFTSHHWTYHVPPDFIFPLRDDGRSCHHQYFSRTLVNDVELLAKFDPVMKDHIHKIESQASHQSYLGKHIQNELIECISGNILSTIVQEIKECKYFSLILDCTPDVSHTEQLSVVIRVVSLEEDPQVKEHFIGFLAVEETTGESLSDLI
ncbi:Zinc finger MYM-type protein 1 [Merluccius polli]|uniref:Zinc finger MYM-type protein 1 n=1 Tax=Merluccius polli TaxID=89951 RepID=A0AA47N628_MERPO|nr:Zinc finger MYM-type protein 1 [Merluccius polli]